jgi:hypothetical protein
MNKIELSNHLARLNELKSEKMILVRISKKTSDNIIKMEIESINLEIAQIRSILSEYRHRIYVEYSTQEIYEEVMGFINSDKHQDILCEYPAVAKALSNYAEGLYDEIKMDESEVE